MADVKQWRVLSGSWLKVLAMLTMVIDHSTIAILRYDSGFAMPLFAIGGKGISSYYLMRYIGRLAFPLFAFLLDGSFFASGQNVFFTLFLEMKKNALRYPVFILRSGRIHFRTEKILSRQNTHERQGCSLMSI